MKKILCLLLILNCFLGSFVFAETEDLVLISDYTSTNISEVQQISNVYLARYGSRIVFADSSITKVSSSDTSIARVTSSRQEIVIGKNGTTKNGFIVHCHGVGRVKLTIRQSGKEDKIVELFVWNYRLRKDGGHFGAQDVFSDATCSNKIGQVSAEAYFSLVPYGDVFQIKDVEFNQVAGKDANVSMAGTEVVINGKLYAKPGGINSSNGSYQGEGELRGSFLRDLRDGNGSTINNHYNIYYLYDANNYRYYTEAVDLYYLYLNETIYEFTLSNNKLTLTLNSPFHRTKTNSTGASSHKGSSKGAGTKWGYYLVKYGSTIKFKGTINGTILSSDVKVAKVEENEVIIVGTGYFNLYINNKRYDFFSWNTMGYHLGGNSNQSNIPVYGSIKQYYDQMNVTTSIQKGTGLLWTDVYLGVDREDKLLKLQDILFGYRSLSDKDVFGYYENYNHPESPINRYIYSYYSQNPQQKNTTNSVWSYCFAKTDTLYELNISNGNLLITKDSWVEKEELRQTIKPYVEPSPKTSTTPTQTILLTTSLIPSPTPTTSPTPSPTPTTSPTPSLTLTTSSTPSPTPTTSTTLSVVPSPTPEITLTTSPILTLTPTPTPSNNVTLKVSTYGNPDVEGRATGNDVVKGYYAVEYGSTIIINGLDGTLVSSDTNIAETTSNRIKVKGIGYFTVAVVKNNNITKYFDFFSYNALLKGRISFSYSQKTGTIGQPSDELYTAPGIKWSRKILADSYLALEEPEKGYAKIINILSNPYISEEYGSLRNGVFYYHYSSYESDFKTSSLIGKYLKSYYVISSGKSLDSRFDYFYNGSSSSYTING